jgi:signal transduction histidine kinase
MVLCNITQDKWIILMFKFHNLSIFNKIVIIIAFVLSGYAVTQSLFVYFQVHEDFLVQKNKIIETKKAEITEKMNMVYELAKQMYYEEAKIETLEKNHRSKLKGIIDTVISTLEFEYNKLKQQGIEDSVIQDQLKDYLRQIRYDDGTGYLFTYNMQGVILTHGDKSLENQLFINKQDALGKYFAQEFIDIGKSPEGEGFSNYYWNKLGYEKPQLKVSYLKKFKSYNWVIGAGVYIDDHLPELEMKIAKLITSYFYDMGKTKSNYFFILTEKAVEVLNGGFPELNGKSVWDLQDVEGHFFTQEMIKMARDSQSKNGFVQYIWHRPVTKDKALKITRVQWFEPFRWTIATGIYLSDLGIEEVQQALQQKTYDIVQKIALSGTVFLLIGIFMSISLVRILTKPLVLAKNAAEEIAKGNFSQEIIYEAKDEIGQLVDTLNTMAKHLQLSFDKLNQQNQELILLNQDKNEFLAIAAHDLKNPLSGILGLSEGILDSNGEMPPEDILEFTTMIKDSAERMFLIITNLLDVNMLESGKISVNLKPIDILPILQNNFQDYVDRAKQKKLTLHLISTQSSYLAYVDKDLVYQILDNLVSNAIKYSPENRNIYLKIFEQQEMIRCEIQDEGQGLTPQDQKKLFSKFQRLSAKPTGGEHSTGLGLFIVKKLVEAQHGRVWCESEIAKGATFIVEFPQSK